MAETKYREEMKKAMTMLAEDPRTIFLGQTVAYSGSRFTYGTFEGVPMAKRIELPIMEEAQMGMSIGMALKGYVPISIYPRADFLLLAGNQLVNHLDKLEEMSNGQFRPHVIVRATAGATKPIYPGPQHCQDYTEALRIMLKHTLVERLERAEDIVPAYRAALERDGPSVLIDVGNFHLLE
jgi:pyruvate dehydrogenase E1 component beta subunit